MRNKSSIDNIDHINKVSRKKDKFFLSMKILVVLLLLLVILSSSILVIRLGNILPNDVDIFFIEPKIADTEISDEKEIWDMNTQIDIFKIEYSNEKGQIIVKSNSGDKVIAPGLTDSYKFQIKNLGNVAVDTKTVISAEVEIDNFEYDNLPIELRFIDYKGNSLSGDDWISVDKFAECISELTVGKNSYIYYVLEWRWAFESDDDEFDTFLGNLSVNSIVKFSINISSKAVQSEELDSTGGLILSEDVPRTGGDIVPVPYIALNLMILIIIIVLIVMHNIKRKKKTEEISKYINE